MNYPTYIIEALIEYAQGAQYRTNINLLAPYGLIDLENRREKTSEAGQIIGWRITDKGKQLLKDINE